MWNWLPLGIETYNRRNHKADGYEVDFIAQDIQGKYEMIQVVWDMNDQKTLERETRALRQAEQKLGFPGRILDCAHRYF